MDSDMESMVKYHDTMIKKHDEEISSLKEMGVMHDARIKKLEEIIEGNQKLMAHLIDIEQGLAKAMVEMTKSQNRMIWKIVGVIGGLIGILGVVIGWIHM